MISHQTREELGPTKEKIETTDVMRGDKTRISEATINGQSETISVTLQEPMIVLKYLCCQPK